MFCLSDHFPSFFTTVKSYILCYLAVSLFLIPMSIATLYVYFSIFPHRSIYLFIIAHICFYAMPGHIVFRLCMLVYVYVYVCQYVSLARVKLFVRGRFQGSCYHSILIFCMSFYIYKCNRNKQESGCEDSYVTVH